MRFSDEGKKATKRRSDEATKGKNLPRSSLRRFVAQSLRRSPPGFSLVEVMIVVVIIGLMATVVTYATMGYLEKAKKQKAKADLATLSGAVDSFYLQNNRFPTNQEGLKPLAPEFVKVLPNDPWGHAYQYVSPGKNGPYDILSYGSDGREGGSGADGDVSSADVDVATGKKR